MHNKYTSSKNPRLTFWAERADKQFYTVMVQVEGYPAREAWPDWLNNEMDADKIAEMLASGKLDYIHPCRKAYGMGCEFCQSETDAFISNHQEVTYAD